MVVKFPVQGFQLSVPSSTECNKHQVQGKVFWGRYGEVHGCFVGRNEVVTPYVDSTATQTHFQIPQAMYDLVQNSALVIDC